jgi:hypothetical protein
MPSAREAFTRLIELASVPDGRQTLAIELCDLLVAWPANYPAEMYSQVEALLRAIAGELDVDTRHSVAARLADSASVPTGLLNEFFFDAPSDVRRKILERNSAVQPPDNNGGARSASREPAIALAVRDCSRVVTAEWLAQAFAIPVEICERILADKSGNALAVACRGAGVSRAKFSTLAVLAGDSRNDPLDACYRRLAAFDDISEPAAVNMLGFWRSRDAAALRDRAA